MQTANNETYRVEKLFTLTQLINNFFNLSKMKLINLQLKLVNLQSILLKTMFTRVKYETY